MKDSDALKYDTLGYDEFFEKRIGCHGLSSCLPTMMHGYSASTDMLDTDKPGASIDMMAGGAENIFIK